MTESYLDNILPSVIIFVCLLRCQAMERLVQSVMNEDELGSEINTALASCLCVSFRDQLEGRIFPNEPTQE